MVTRTSRIAEHRRRAGLTQTQLASRSGLHLSTITRFEGGSLPKYRRECLERVADALGVEVSELTGEVDGGR